MENVQSTTLNRYSDTGWLGKQHVYFRDSQKPLSKSLVRNIMSYAMKRLDPDIAEMVTAKHWKISIDRLSDNDNEPLNDSTYQVNFTNERGLRISIDGILLNNYRPCLDHGFGLDEDQ